MPLPRGLTFDDRLAPFKHPKRGAGHLFICQRKPHRFYEEFIPGFKSDAKAVRAAHDVEFHFYARRRGNTPVIIEHLCDEWLAHIGQLEREGLRDEATTRHYAIACGYLKRGMKAIGVRTNLDLDSSRLSEFIRWMREHSKSKGALIVDALSALRTMLRWKWLPVDWRIPHDEIRAEKQAKLDLDGETIRKLIGAMKEGSMVEAIAFLKARTGARDVEIFTARKEEFDLNLHIEIDGRTVNVGVFRPILRNKGKATRKRHLYVLTSDVVGKVRRFVTRAPAGGYVFSQGNGRHVTRESLRPYVRAASKKAGFVKLKHDARKEKPYRIGAIDSLAQIRSEVATIVEGELSLEEAAQQIGHADAATTGRWYVKNRLTMRKLVERYRPAEIIAKAIPLRSLSANVHAE